MPPNSGINPARMPRRKQSLVLVGPVDPSRSIRLRLTDPQLTAPLEKSLRDADCLVRRTGTDTLHVRFAGVPAAEARAELSFFLAAWAGRRPEPLGVVVV